MKNIRQQIRPIAPSVPTASMADIAFLLIIFFMLTTSFSPEKTSVQLPESLIQAAVEEGVSIIAVTEDGTIAFTPGEQRSTVIDSLDALGQLVKEIVEIIPEKEFAIKADRTAPYRMVDGVLDALRKNGARRIGLLTRPEAGSGPTGG